jgi:acyl-CoA synthetase (NDP forming)/RimJ/RimL family protein N-acetyltransferase
MWTPEERVYPAHWEADVVLRDGGTALIRPITPDDAQRLVSFYEQVSDESKFYRFFSPYPRLSDSDVRRFTHHDYVDRVGLAATVGGEFIATVRYDRVDDEGVAATGAASQAEVAFLVRDDHQSRGVASAMLEHIAAVARERGIRRFEAEVLFANTKMIKVFKEAGFSQRRTFEDGSVHLTLDLEPTERSLAVMHAREQRAEGRSVRRLLAPRSVAVIGVSRQPRGAGRQILENLREGGYTGRVYAVNNALPESSQSADTSGDGDGEDRSARDGGRDGATAPAGIGGFPAYRSLREIPGELDLAVIAVPAAAVPDVARECGEAGVHGLVVLSADFSRDEQRELVRLARSYGTRVIGPNAYGLMNTAPDVRLNTTLFSEILHRGRVGLFTQSGAIGIALLAGLRERGTGLSSFVSAGNRADVSGNDVLQHWDDDPDTDVALLYLESIGNPRKFTRLACRTAWRKPVVVVKGAQHSGSAPPPGHAAPVFRTPTATVSTLLRQAGVIMVDTVTELLDAGALLSCQPLPQGPRTAILGNAQSLGLLTYDACLTHGLRPHPVRDLTTSATPAEYADALREALADPATDSVVVTAIPWVGDAHAAVLAETLREITAEAEAEAAGEKEGEGAADAEGMTEAQAMGEARAKSGKPVVVVHLAIEGLDAALAERGIPAYPAAERAVRALSEAHGYARWRREAREPGRVPEFEVREAAAADLLARATAPETEPGPRSGAGPGPESASAASGAPGPEAAEGALPSGHREARPTTVSATTSERSRSHTLTADDTAALLAYYGIALEPTRPACDADEAVRAARGLGYPIALKTTAPHLRHRADLGGVRLGIPDDTALRAAFGELTEALGKPSELHPVVQAMAPRGVDTVIRGAFDPSIGAVLSFGLAGTPSELLGDIVHRLVPVTDRDVADMIRTIRSAPILFGWRGAQPVDTASLEDLLLRVSRMLNEHPQIVAVDLEPVVVAPRGSTVLGATVRVAEPPSQAELGTRRLPAY